MPFGNQNPFAFKQVRPIPSHTTDTSRLVAKRSNPDWFNQFVQPQLETFKQQPLMQAKELADSILGDPTDPANMNVAGIAFSPGKQVYHGTTQAFKKFNPRYNDAGDLFGRMTHFAEDARYADEFAHTAQWGNPKTDYDAAYWAELGSPRPKSNIIPARLDVKNAIDVSSNDPSAIDFKDWMKLIDAYTERGGRAARGEKKLLEDTVFQMAESMQARGGKDYHLGMGASKAPNKVPRDYLESLLASEPLALSDAGFDAVRYQDNIATSHLKNPNVWAIENPALAKSPYSGEPLGLNVKPSNLSRVVPSGGGYHLINPKVKKSAPLSMIEPLLKQRVPSANYHELLNNPEFAKQFRDTYGLDSLYNMQRSNRLTDRFIRRGR